MDGLTSGLFKVSKKSELYDTSRSHLKVYAPSNTTLTQAFVSPPYLDYTLTTSTKFAILPAHRPYAPVR